MPCTTILVGKNASYNGSTLAARNEDSGAGAFDPKKFIVVQPEEQPKHYKSILSHVEIPLPEDPMRYTAMPNAVDKEGIWGAAGVNEENISMTATETITSNERVLAADSLVEYIPAKDGKPEVKGGIGEEDIVSITLPYIHTAREGVIRLGVLLEEYGTYEMNGIAFQDKDEIWWLETIGGHHWIAKRVPDDAYVIMPNQFGIDNFDLEDAFGNQKEHMCSVDLREFIAENHLDLSMGGHFNARDAFGSHSDSDHIYNTPRAWILQKYFNPKTVKWEGENAEHGPESDDIPWQRIPEKKITVEDIKYALSNHFQGTEFDPYGKHGDGAKRGCYRSIGVNRTNFLSLTEIRPDQPFESSAIEWVAFGSNVFNAFVPFYANVDTTPEYFANAGEKVTTESFYWANRIIAAMADASWSKCSSHIERYQEKVQAAGRAIINRYDKKKLSGKDREQANQEIADMVKEETDKLLANVLYERSCEMKNGFSRSDA
jgi:dipeptidase